MQNVFIIIRGYLFGDIILADNKIKQVKEVQKAGIPGAQPKRIAVIDDFTNNSVFIDDDFLPDIPHGAVVARFIREGLPNAKIEPFDISNDKNRSSGTKIALDKILTDIDKGVKYDALNLSSGYGFDFGMLSASLRKIITPVNIKEHKEEVKNWFNAADVGKKEADVRDIIAKLEKLSSRGVKIYVSAGNNENSHPNDFNMFTLANGVKSVGALDSHRRKSKLSVKDSLITNWETGVFKIRKMRDKNGQMGFDYTGDGTVDIYIEQTTSQKKKPQDFLAGTSFAAPKVLVKDNRT